MGLASFFQAFTASDLTAVRVFPKFPIAEVLLYQSQKVSRPACNIQVSFILTIGERSTDTVVRLSEGEIGFDKDL